MKKTIKNKTIFFIIIVISVLLSASVFTLMGHVQNLLNSDVKINLTETVTQNKDVVATKLKLETNNIKTIANSITEKMEQAHRTDQDFQQEILKNLTTEHDNPYIAISDISGNAVFRNGKEIDISGRNYFKLAIGGSQNISEKIISRLDGKDLYIISTPLHYNNKIIGALQKGYTTESMYDICSLSLFSDNGNMYIINSDGYIVIHSQQSDYKEGTDNYYRSLYSEGNPEASVQLEKDIKQNKSGFFESARNNEKMFSAYTPIDDIHDWYLITSVPVNAVSPNGEIVVKLFYSILLFVVVIITLVAMLFLWYKNRQQSALKEIAFVDSITGGPTYNKFVIDTTKAFLDHPNKKFYILKFDIDNFKYINNYYGFDFGDYILQIIYKNISQDLQGHEVLARISSDQFVALLEDASQERIAGFLNKIQKSDNQISIYCSAGIYEINDFNEPINLMVDKARTAAQTVKDSLNEKYAYFQDSFNQLTAHNEQLKRAVINAIENDEFVPYFQPKVDVNTGELVGSEALVRWLSNGKVITPFEFIPMCERTGIIVDIDLLLFEKVLQFLKSNIDLGVRCTPISVNFSRLHLNNPDFIETLTSRLNYYNVPAELIEVELTESAFFDNLDSIRDFTDQLHQHGIRMAMDDFGSGYSSLNMLKDIPIDVLKIDKEFLSSKESNRRQEIVFDSIVKMAHNLNIRVVVEGVETIENVNLMKYSQCRIAQGYYFARPMPEDKFNKVFKEGVLE